MPKSSGFRAGDQEACMHRRIIVRPDGSLQRSFQQFHILKLTSSGQSAGLGNEALQITLGKPRLEWSIPTAAEEEYRKGHDERDAMG
jgi:hypothetical protein